MSVNIGWSNFTSLCFTLSRWYYLEFFLHQFININLKSLECGMELLAVWSMWGKSHPFPNLEIRLCLYPPISLTAALLGPVNTISHYHLLFFGEDVGFLFSSITNCHWRIQWYKKGATKLKDCHTSAQHGRKVMCGIIFPSWRRAC